MLDLLKRLRWFTLIAICLSIASVVVLIIASASSALVLAVLAAVFAFLALRET